MVFGTAAPPSRGPIQASWEPNFRPALPAILFCISWLFFLCLTLPSRSQGWRLIRLASFPALAAVSIPLAFDRQYTCGNPLRDLVLPTVTWSIMCKVVEICLVYSKGGPKPIRPFVRNAQRPVHEMQVGYAMYEWKEVEFPKLFSLDRLIYGLDVLLLRRPGTSLVLPKQGRALEWSKKGLNDWSRHLEVNMCLPEEVPAHAAVRRFGRPEMPLWAGLIQTLLVWASFRWLYALAGPSTELFSVMGLYIPVASPPSRDFWHAILPCALTEKHLVLLGTPSSVNELPFPTALAMVAALGGAVCLVPGFLESIALQLWTPTPATCFLSSFERPLTSPSIARLWARSWHATSQRDYLNMASILPLSRHPALQTLYVFFWSGVQHSFMFARLRVNPSAKLNLHTLLAGMIDVGMMTFFLSQGVGILLEKAVLDALPPACKKQRGRVAVVRRVWMFVVLFLPGFFFLDSILRKHVMTKDVLDGFAIKNLELMFAGKAYEPGV